MERGMRAEEEGRTEEGGEKKERERERERERRKRER